MVSEDIASKEEGAAFGGKNGVVFQGKGRAYYFFYKKKNCLNYCFLKN